MNAILEKITYSDSALFQTGEYILPQFNAPWHFHPELELTYIVKSEGVRLVGEGSCSMGLDLFIVLDEVFRGVLLFETILFVSSHLGLN